MNNHHTSLLRALIAAQVAVIEHADEEFNCNKAKLALLVCLSEATKLAKKLDN